MKSLRSCLILAAALTLAATESVAAFDIEAIAAAARYFPKTRCRHLQTHCRWAWTRWNWTWG
jgi:hypothetical protein